MVKQYPHTLTVTKVNETTRDENGDYSQADVGGTITRECRAESSSSNGYLTSEDGNKIDFSWIVYLPLSDLNIVIGSKATVTDNGQTVLNDTVKRYSKGQLNARIWL